MKSLTSIGVPAKRLVSWFVSSAFAGWFVVYNVLRALAGDSPHQAALPSILLGGVLGGALVFAGVIATRRWMTSKNLVASADEPGAVTPVPRPGVLSALMVTSAVTAGVAVVVGGVLLAQWKSADPAARSATKLIVGLWSLPVGLWLGAEAVALRQRDVRGVEIMSAAGVVSVLMGGVALAQRALPVGQVALILAGGALAILAQVAIGRNTGPARFATPAGTAIVMVLALLLPAIN